MEIIGWVVAVSFILVGVFTALRWVHYEFKVREIMVQAQMRDVNIHTAGVELHAMTEDMIKNINDQLQKTFMGES